MTDKKFTSLRKRLDQFGYRQPLVIESIPLVEKLFSDLIHTTESFKNYKSKNVRSEKSIPAYDISEPYRNDNAKLVRENNGLHLQLIKVKEENESLIIALKSSTQKLENENQDLRFLNSQYVHKIKGLEKEGKQKSELIQNLQEKNMNAVIETPGGRKKNIPFRRQRMDLESTLPPSVHSFSDTFLSASDPYVADLLSIADSRVEELKINIEDLKSIKQKLERKSTSYKKQLDLRDKEIRRLNKLLDGGRPVEAVLKENHRSSSDKVVAHLNMQVDYLQQANRDLEKQLLQNQQLQSEATSSIKKLQERNEELCMELAAMDKLYKNIGKEKQRGDVEVDNQIEVLKDEIEEKHQKLLDLQSNNYQLRKERDELIEESEKLNVVLKTAQDNKETIAELFTRCDKEKARLARKNAKLTVSERELAMDLERLKVSKGVLPKKSPNRLEYLVRNLEDDRDYYKKECDTFQQMFHKHLFNKTEESTDKKSEPGAMIDLLTKERNYYKKEYELLRISRNITLQSPPTKDKPEKSSNEVSRLRRERDELQKMLESFESQLTEIQENVRGVTTDRDNVQLLYEQSTEEIQRLRRQISRARSPSSMSRKVTEILEKAEKERDEALNELRRARIDIQNLKDEIKNSQNQQFTDKRKHNSKQRDVEDLLSKFEADNVNLNNRVTSTQNMIHNLEDQLSSANKTIQSLNDEIIEKEAELSKMRLLLEQTDQSCNDMRRKLEGKTIELENQENDNNTLEMKNDSMQRKELEYKNEIVRLKGIISSLDHERDNLQHEVDDKAEQLVHLDDGLREQEKADEDLKLSIEELEENLRYREHELTSKERELTSLSKQLRNVEEELAAMSKTRDVTLKENKRLQEDLAIMTDENQLVHKNLQGVLDEGHSLKEQIEEYGLHLTRIQDLLAEKEMEKEELLLQYKTLSNKADMLETNMQQSEDEAETYKQDVLHKQQELNFLQDRCSSLEAEVEQHITTEESYEHQVEALSQSVANMEAQLRVCREEKDTILEDLFAVRELCVKLDKNREELMKQIAEKTTGNEKLEIMLKETHSETEALKNQVNQEKGNIKSLENIISASREKEFFEKRNHDEDLMDLKLLKENLSKVDHEKKHADTENTRLRKQNISLEEELTSLRQKLTAEKFEKERLTQELRRTSQSSPVTGLNKPSEYTSHYNHIQTNEYQMNRGSYLATTKPLSLLPSSRADMDHSFSSLNVSISSDEGSKN